MFNLLIVEKVPILAQRLINCICKKFSNIRLYNIAISETEAINVIKEQKIDIILLDLTLPDISGEKIINYISINELYMYKNSIICIENSYKPTFNFNNIPYVFTSIPHNANINSLITTIRSLINYKIPELNSKIIKEKINKLLHDLNFNFSYVGTKYLSDCIYETYYLYKHHTVNLQKDVYPIIAKKYNKSVSNIKSCIFKSINLMYYDCEEEILKNFLKLNILISNPKPKDFIIEIIEKLQNIKC